MKIAICTPYYGDVTPQYALSLANLILFTGRCQFEFNGHPAVPEIKPFMRTSSLVPEARTWLADDALEWGANYLLWIDSDHSFPEDALVRLLSHNRDMIGANYARRTRPSLPTARDDRGGPIWTTEAQAKAGEVQEVHDVGLGFCLVSVPVIQALKATGKPLFALAMSPDYKHFVGEDYYFCELVRGSGRKIHVDHALSWEVGHVFRSELFNRDVIADRLSGRGGDPLPA
jgi:hypothetical protein